MSGMSARVGSMAYRRLLKSLKSISRASPVEKRVLDCEEFGKDIKSPRTLAR